MLVSEFFLKINLLEQVRRPDASFIILFNSYIVKTDFNFVSGKPVKTHPRGSS